LNRGIRFQPETEIPQPETEISSAKLKGLQAQLALTEARAERAEERLREIEKVNNRFLATIERLEGELKQSKKQLERIKGNMLEPCSIDGLVALEDDVKKGFKSNHAPASL